MIYFILPEQGFSLFILNIIWTINTIIEGTDGVGKTTTIIELIKSGIICQDRCMDMISKNMIFDISIKERVNKYQNYLKNIDKKIIIMINNDKEE